MSKKYPRVSETCYTRFLRTMTPTTQEGTVKSRIMIRTGRIHPRPIILTLRTCRPVGAAWRTLHKTPATEARNKTFIIKGAERLPFGLRPRTSTSRRHWSKYYHKPAAAACSHRAPDFHLDFRRRKDAFRIIQNFERSKFGQRARVAMESYLLTKGLLKEETKELSRSIQKILPPA